MLDFFKVNDPYRLFFVFILLIVVWVLKLIVLDPFYEIEFKWILLGERLSDGFHMYSETFDYTAPLSAFVYKIVYFIFGRSRWGYQLVALLIVFYQAGYLNVVLLRNKAFKENNYFVGLFYVLVVLSFPVNFMLSPQLMSLTWIILALGNVFRRIDNQATDEIFLRAGVYLGIASLFYIPSIFFSIIFLVALLLFSNPILRRIGLLIIGVLLPILICFSYYYWRGEQFEFLTSYIQRGIISERIYFFSLNEVLLYCIAYGVVLVVCLFNSLGRRLINFQVRIQEVMLLLLLGGILAVLIDIEMGFHQLIFVAPTVSFFIAHYMLSLKKWYFLFFMPYILLLGFLVYPFLWNSQASRIQDYEKKPSTKALYFGNNGFRVYSQNQIASPFIDPVLSESWLERLDYYQSASQVYESIYKSRPDRIVNDLNASRIMERFPILESQYEKRGNVYQRITD